jgi:hypothetical protein
MVEMRDPSELWVKNEPKVCDCIGWDYGLIVDVNGRKINVTFSSEDHELTFVRSDFKKCR